jgi:hypothetical protein
MNIENKKQSKYYSEAQKRAIYKWNETHKEKDLKNKRRNNEKYRNNNREKIRQHALKMYHFKRECNRLNALGDLNVNNN